MEPFMMIAPPSGISGNAFCTVNSVPLTLTFDDLVEARLGDGFDGNAEFADAGAGEDDIHPAFLGLDLGV